MKYITIIAIMSLGMPSFNHAVGLNVIESLENAIYKTTKLKKCFTKLLNPEDPDSKIKSQTTLPALIDTIFQEACAVKNFIRFHYAYLLKQFIQNNTSFKASRKQQFSRWISKKIKIDHLATCKKQHMISEVQKVYQLIQSFSPYNNKDLHTHMIQTKCKV